MLAGNLLHTKQKRCSCSLSGKENLQHVSGSWTEELLYFIISALHISFGLLVCLKTFELMPNIREFAAGLKLLTCSSAGVPFRFCSTGTVTEPE